MRSAVLLVAALATLTGCATVAAGATAPSAEVAAVALPSPEATVLSSRTPPAPALTTGSPAPRTPSTTPSVTPSATDRTTTSARASSTAGATSPSVPPSDPAPVGSFVLGDSIALSAAPLLSRYGYPVTGRVGQSAHAAFLQQHLSGSQAQSAPGWVIVLGTNNRGDQTDIARLTEWIDLIAELRTPGAKQQVYWVTPHRPDAYTGGLSAWSLREFNAELARLAEQHRWLHVIDFDAQAVAHPEWFAQDSGHLHPDLDGQQALAALIAGADAIPTASPAPITTLEWPPPAPSPTPVAGGDEVFGGTAE